MTVMQLVAAVGAVEMLEAMVETLLDKRHCDDALKYLVPAPVKRTVDSEHADQSSRRENGSEFTGR